ncbi:MAG: ABC transporter permease [Clostridia bacterium]|nr:ABC transporter permease [Clostridia bacterium]
MSDKVNRKILKASGIVALVMLGALLVVGLLELVVLSMRGRLGFLDAGKRWSANGDRFAVVSLYAEQSAGLTGDDAVGWARSIDAGLLEASITPKEGASSWAYCYAADDTLSVKGPKGTVSAKTLAVGGEFFVFHPLAFKYGGGFLSDESIPRGVVLDRDLAWRVYGAENIIGMTVEIGGEEFVIVGIAERESKSGPYKRAYGDTPRLYMSYAGYRKVGEANVTSFEAALPNPVTGFAANIFTDKVRTDESRSVIREVTDRFSLKNRFANMKELSYAWVSVNKIEYPYWENEARVYDYRAAVLMIFEVTAAAVAVFSLLLSFTLLRVSGYSVIQSAKNGWKKLSEARAKKKRERPAKPQKSRKAKPKETEKETKSEETQEQPSESETEFLPDENPEERGNP